VSLSFSSDSSGSKDTEGENIEGVEYAARSLDGSQSGQSLEGFFNDQDSGSIQGPSFYRALDNEDMVNPAQVALGTPSNDLHAPNLA
jgi:hypothetical protein